MIIAVDFDGTIVEHKYPKIGKTQLFAFETLKQLQKQNHKLILWTYRAAEELEAAVNFCKENGIEFYAINENYPNEKLDTNKVSRKIYADFYIDDRNIGGFLGWSKIWELLSNSDELLKMENELNKTNFSSKLKSIFGKK